jgi:hypothetical protein
MLENYKYIADSYRAQSKLYMQLYFILLERYEFYNCSLSNVTIFSVKINVNLNI